MTAHIKFLLNSLSRTTFLFTAKRSDLKQLIYGHCTLSTNENQACISSEMAPQTTILLYSLSRATFVFTAKRSDLKWPNYCHCTFSTNENPAYISCKMAPDITISKYSLSRATFLFMAKISQLIWPSYGHCTLSTNGRPGHSEQTLVILYSPQSFCTVNQSFCTVPHSDSYKRVIHHLKSSVGIYMPYVMVVTPAFL